MSSDILSSIESPKDLKKLTQDEMKELAVDIRAEIIAATSKVGGHIAPSLGAVEIILAAHRVLDCPCDKLLFDVGHQAYAHKLITGRYKNFFTIRQCKGISGFPKRVESEYDVHDSGHASDSLATALGIAIARDQSGDDYKIVTIIGDAAITGGMSFEALNQIGALKKSMVIILNDNEMSISPTVGELSHYLAQLRTNRRYIKTSQALHAAIDKLKDVTPILAHGAEQAKSSFKQLVVPGMLFEHFGIKYLGPIDGHDIPLLEESIHGALALNTPVVIHTVTKKGCGYPPAEQNPERFHGTSPFDVNDGSSLKPAGGPISYTKAFSKQLIKEAREDRNIFAITAAMASGTGLDAFNFTFPDRFLDVGIAEECAVTTASGLAIAGKKPVVAIYSTFLQRSFDQIVTNVCEPNLDVVFAVDRAGLVGEDGPTHHGMFDMSYLRCMPNMKIISPSNEAELARAVHTAFKLPGPVAVRYPRGSAEGVQMPDNPEVLTPGKARIEAKSKTKEVAFIAIGRMVGQARRAREILADKGVDATLIDARWVKPIDDEAVAFAATHDLIVTIEEGVLQGGFSSAVLESLSSQDLCVNVERIGIDNKFIEHGSIQDLFEECKLTPEAIAETTCNALKELKA